ncbi:DUF2163 domain-containing protein [Martelella endophytica]|uniref:Beta tubulin, autoregulation binding site n=1 Tax=Martelella endophytica TaxID=1486262 RepID=A0A0D5LV22_MAREN|nr:DUF2163 domain-containing protein [Martelella endophytica]AJY47228.1 beta tubulin, autoregulation binding site [Martelella endophytica]
MRDLQAGLKAHLEQEATTTCFCWRVLLKDGSVLGFTEHDHDLGFAGTVFLAGTGFAASTVETEEGLSATTNEVAGGFSSEVITEAALVAGRYDGARVEVYLVNWQNVTEHQLMHVHEIGEVTREAGRFRAELRAVTHRLSQPQGRSFARRCDVTLGDGKCGFNTSTPGFFATGTVIAVENETRIAVSVGGDFATGFFSFGVLAFESGALAGVKADIETNAGSGGTLWLGLWLPLEGTPAPGDAVRLTAGCDKSFSTCRSKFSNLVNFRGFPHMPGADFAYSYVDGESQHDGGVLFR